jgi:hypothetical protein
MTGMLAGMADARTGIKPRLCSRHLLRLENPCYNACFTILVLDILANMPAGQNRSNCAFRNGFLRLATMLPALSGLNDLQIISLRGQS